MGRSQSESSNTSRHQTQLEALLDEIKFQRRKELRSFNQDPGFTLAHNTTYWTDLFVRNFLFQSEPSIDSDDLLFFVRKRELASSHYRANRVESEVEVFRRDSRKLPIGDPDIDWEETIYLNLIIHLFEYKITLAICTRTSPTNLQVIQRASQEVWATPSHRRMDSKADGEEIIYPYLCFSIDNFDEAFSDIQVRDGEMVAVELVARDTKGTREAVLSLGCVQFDSVRRVYDARQSQSVTQRLSQTNLISIFMPQKERVEFIHVRGKDDKGHVELAILRPKGAGCDTPSSEPGCSLTDQLEDGLFCEEDLASDFMAPQLNNTFQKGHQRTPTEGEGTLEKWRNPMIEIEAGDIRDCLDDGKTNPLWTMKGYTQAFHGWKETRRAGCTPLKVQLTYLTLPWWSIIKDILDNSDFPLLTF